MQGSPIEGYDYVRITLTKYKDILFQSICFTFTGYKCHLDVPKKSHVENECSLNTEFIRNTKD